MRIALLLLSLAAPSWASYITTFEIDVTPELIASVAPYQFFNEIGFSYFPAFSVRLPFFWAPVTDIVSIGALPTPDGCAGWMPSACDNGQYAPFFFHVANVPGHYTAAITAEHNYQIGPAPGVKIVENPEPGSWLMLATGLLGLLLYGYRQTLRKSEPR